MKPRVGGRISKGYVRGEGTPEACSDIQKSSAGSLGAGMPYSLHLDGTFIRIMITNDLTHLYSWIPIKELGSLNLWP